MVRSRISNQDLKKAAEDLDGYVKFVVDIERGILTAGGTRHAEEGDLLLKDGSGQGNLWGGGLDLETNEIDFDSMINIRPNDGNPSREVLNPSIRNTISAIVRLLLQ